MSARALGTTYYTISGDHADALARRLLGHESRVVELLELNPHMLAYGPVLPANVRVDVPQAAQLAPAKAATAAVVRLW